MALFCGAFVELLRWHGLCSAAATMAGTRAPRTHRASDTREIVRGPAESRELHAIRRRLGQSRETLVRAASLDTIHLQRTLLLETVDALDALCNALSSHDDSASPARRRLVIDERGEWFSVEGAPAVTLRRTAALRRILLALARSVGPLSARVLVTAGWPDERVMGPAGGVRVRTAVATLRRLGLRSVLVTTDGGYALDAEVVLCESDLDAEEEPRTSRLTIFHGLGGARSRKPCSR